jgi:hypothetical protein
MLRARDNREVRARRGFILVVVLALLTLFAVVGLSFVFYANTAAVSSRLFREAETQSQPDIAPELLLAHFLGQLVYDVPDDERGLYSCLRGHSLARNMYGLNYTKVAGGPLRYDDSRGVPLNQVPFNGTGRLHTKLPVAGAAAPGTYNNPFQPGIDDYLLINYTYFPKDGFIRDPERFGALVVQGPRTQYRPYRTDPKFVNEMPGYYVGGFNAPYTYPDLNNLFLAAVKAGTGDLPPPLGKVTAGTVLMPSFHRPWLFGSLTDPKNPNWTNREGKYKILRPRPRDQKRHPDDPHEPELFPYPEDEGGDVKNLVGSPGLVYLDHGQPKLANNDSIWLDLDFPVLTAPDGRKFKPLFAPLVLDLDNRVNLDVHGNLRGTGRADHASNQGWGPWEVNVGRVLNASPPEWQSLFQTKTGLTGRYGRDNYPHTPLAPYKDPYPHIYAALDFDGSDQHKDGAPSGPLMLAPTPGPQAVPYQSFPDPPAGYSYDSGFLAERIEHPNLYNPFTPTLPDRLFALSNLEALLRYGDTGSPALTSELFRSCPQNFGDWSDPAAALRRRGLVTLRSFDLDRPGVAPWFWADARGANYNRWPPLLPNHSPHPAGGPIGAPPFPPNFAPGADSDFGTDWRAAARLSSLRRLDLNRHLPDYPKPSEKGVIDDLEQFLVAQRARQFFAAEIFEVLWRVTGTGDPASILVPPTSLSDPLYSRWNAMRALAQLAVNIVDFIDADDYSTPFRWHASGQWVYGTELPRLVLNEAYVQYANDPNDPRIAKEQKASVYDINVWVELLNPLLANPADSNENQVNLVNGNYSAYQIVLCKNASRLRQLDNVTGAQTSLKTPAKKNAIVRFTEPTSIPPVSKNYRGNGFCVVGPPLPTVAVDENPRLPANLLSPEMTAQVKPTGVAPITILLRRLACPHLPPQPDALSPFFNPYITVDYMEDVPANDVLKFYNTGPRDLPLPSLLDRASYGRMEPYAGHKSMLRRQSPEPTALLQPQIQHTFGRHNGIEPDNPNPRRPGQTLKLPFDWLVHLDRKLISPIELLHVSAFKPHELTQEFMSPTGPFHHRAPWFDEDLPAPNSTDASSHRLYRALEFLGTHNQTVGMMAVSVKSEAPISPPQLPDDSTRTFTAQRFGTTATGGTWEIVAGSSLIIDKDRPNEEVVRVNRIVNTVPPNRAVFKATFIRRHDEPFTITPTTISERIPGKININTIWDPETLMALCDPQPSNAFTEAQIAHIFKRLLRQRSKQGWPRKDDRPFRSVATGLYPARGEIQFPGSSIDNTALQQKRAGDPSRERLFQTPVSPAHPYLQYQLLNKIFNNLTVRSNVFAVWVTVGFFEVTDASTRPVKLGAEMGRGENRQIRHRLFAIVDRSLLQYNPGPQPQFDARVTPSPGAATGLVVPYFSIIE